MHAKHLLQPNPHALPQRGPMAQETPVVDLLAVPSPGAPRGHMHRQRDFGIGYGNSSGYGSALHFIDGHVDAPFRFR